VSRVNVSAELWGSPKDQDPFLHGSTESSFPLLNITGISNELLSLVIGDQTGNRIIKCLTGFFRHESVAHMPGVRATLKGAGSHSCALSHPFTLISKFRD